MNIQPTQSSPNLYQTETEQPKAPQERPVERPPIPEDRVPISTSSDVEIRVHTGDSVR
jgi:hypothetical protein